MTQAAHVVGAQFYCTPIADLLPFFPAAVAMVAAAIALLYMLARAFARRDLEALANEELRQLVVSILLGLGLFSAASLTCLAATAAMAEFAGGRYANQFDYAVSYLRDYIIGGIGLPTIAQIWHTQQSLRYAAHFEVAIPLKAQGEITIEPTDALDPISAALDMVGNLFFVPMLISLNVQLILLNFAQAFAITAFLPMGVVLRVIPQTREAGCFFLASAFGLYVVYPFLYVVNYNISTNYIAPHIKAETKEVTEYIERELVMEEIPVLKVPAPEVVREVPLRPLARFWTYFWKIFVETMPPFDAALLLLHAAVIPLLVISLTIGFISIFTDFLKEVG